jgi:hypothetical protein
LSSSVGRLNAAVDEPPSELSPASLSCAVDHPPKSGRGPRSIQVRCSWPLRRGWARASPQPQSRRSARGRTTLIAARTGPMLLAAEESASELRSAAAPGLLAPSRPGWNAGAGSSSCGWSSPGLLSRGLTVDQGLPARAATSSPVKQLQASPLSGLSPGHGLGRRRSLIQVVKERCAPVRLTPGRSRV